MADPTVSPPLSGGKRRKNSIAGSRLKGRRPVMRDVIPENEEVDVVMGDEVKSEPTRLAEEKGARDKNALKQNWQVKEEPFLPNQKAKGEWRYQKGAETQASIPDILEANRNLNPRLSYKIKYKDAPFLQPNFPNRKLRAGTIYRVLPQDTIDTAMMLDNSRELLGLADTTPVCILNFAYYNAPANYWPDENATQEANICNRTTLTANLRPEFYPLEDDECIYAPNVFVFRENEEKGYSYMWTERAKILPRISVISMASTYNDPIPKYLQDGQQERVIRDQMRVVLRVAASTFHYRLILGAWGCGSSGHLHTDMAAAWREVLLEPEFKGWFDLIVFAIIDEPGKNTFSTFKHYLDNLELKANPGPPGLN